jgi:anti-sigma regulatory factor (Ser/Thr protein kinase)
LIHDMQNTAMVLREASSQLHDNRSSLPPGVVEHLTEMVARRSDMLVKLLADLSISHLAERGELDLSLQAVSLSDICGELLADRQPTVPAQVTFEVPDDAVVIADPTRITQVLDNLLTNAFRYGGPNVQVSAVRDVNHVRLIVSDDGPGVPDDMVDTLFDAYVHGAASQRLGGSGLGLLIVQQLCDAMNATIEYDGTEGARFTATFPALQTPSLELDADVAGAGHSVAFWHAEEDLAESLVSYVANGLCAGEAVLVAVTPAHHRLLEAGLAAVGIDPAAATASGQYVAIDANAVHTDLPRYRHIDRDRFDSLIGETVERVRSHWQSFRAFGEIVDLYWRRGDNHLALDLEACWNELRAAAPFPLLCAYELAPGESAGAICDAHDIVVSA